LAKTEKEVMEKAEERFMEETPHDFDVVIAEIAKPIKTVCSGCGKKLNKGDNYWGNNQIGVFCENCGKGEIAYWWRTI